MDILLVRHGETPANVDKETYLTTADHDVPLSALGEEQGAQVAEFLEQWCAQHWPNVRPRLWTSSYRRARQTGDRIEAVLGDRLLDRREHVLLVEQQFGLFDGLHDEECAERYPDEYAHFKRCCDHNGKFWARNPLGESRFDVATRVHQSFGTYHRDADRHGVDHLIVVCHGTTLRAFTMMWCHLSPEWFEAEPNPGNCAVRRIKGAVDLRYIFDGFPN